MTTTPRKPTRAESLFWDLIDELREHDDRIEEGTIMGGRCARVAGEFLGLVDYKNSGMVVKLPRTRVDELIAQGIPTLSTRQAADDLFGGSVIGLDNWESYDFGVVTITAMPALHGPPGSEPMVGPVIGFMLESPGEPSIYVSGDNASLPLVQQIADRFAPVDIALLFAGAARVDEIDADLTLNSTDAATAAKSLGARLVVGLHTEDWTHFSHTRTQLEEAFEGAGVLAHTPRGVRVELPV